MRDGAVPSPASPIPVLDAMSRLGAEPARIRAAVGPCIGAAAYEVGSEFEAQFRVADSENARFFIRYRTRTPAFDLPAYVAHRLKLASIERVEVWDGALMRSEDNFFSYRRTTHRKESDYGRQLSAIVLSALICWRI